MTTNGGNQETLAAKGPVAFGDYQFEIYAAGLSGTLPSLPMVYAELEARAEKVLSPSLLSYVAGWRS